MVAARHRVRHVSEMAEIRTVTTLRHKQREIENAIAGYEKRIQQARAHLAAHQCQAIAINPEVTGERESLQPYKDEYRLFAHG